MAIIKVILVIMIMAGMVMVLLSIRHLSTGEFHATNDEADVLRQEVSEDNRIITRGNIFSRLLEKTTK